MRADRALNVPAPARACDFRRYVAAFCDRYLARLPGCRRWPASAVELVPALQGPCSDPGLPGEDRERDLVFDMQPKNTPPLGRVHKKMLEVPDQRHFAVRHVSKTNHALEIRNFSLTLGRGPTCLEKLYLSETSVYRASWY